VSVGVAGLSVTPGPRGWEVATATRLRGRTGSSVSPWPGSV
jgi:hypothetical protein